MERRPLCRALFSDKAYVSLEPLDQRRYAVDDPRGFLSEYGAGAVIDEAHHAPLLFSYLQEEVDRRPDPGRFILTGSQHFGLTETISQSLAGRVGVTTLLPPGLDELRGFESAPTELESTLVAGAYPRIFDRNVPYARWLSDYITTYVQRDVRQILNVGDLETFTTFLGLCAGRAGQELHLSGLGSDAGVSHNTARSWLSVLEASFICFRTPAWRRNVRKQMIKAPKLYFFDSGLLCHLLGIRTPDHLRHHPLRGAVFESWVASEIYKARVHRGNAPRISHYRDAKRLEVDFVIDKSDETLPVEAKSAATVAPTFFDSLRRLRAATNMASVRSLVVYGGDRREKRSDVEVVNWSTIADVAWADVA